MVCPQRLGADAGRGQTSSREPAPCPPHRAFGWGALVGALACGALLAVGAPALRGAPGPGRGAKFAGAAFSEGEDVAGVDEELLELIPEIVRAISADSEVREHTAAVARQLEESMTRDPELRDMAKALAAQVHDVMHSQKAKAAAERFADILEVAAVQFSEVMEDTDDLATMARHMESVFAMLMKSLMADPKINEMVKFASREFELFFERVLSHEHAGLVQSIEALKTLFTSQLLPLHKLAGEAPEVSLAEASRAFMSLGMPSTGALRLGRPSPPGAFGPASPAAQHSPASRGRPGALSMQEQGSPVDATKLFQKMLFTFLAATIAVTPPQSAFHAFVAPAVATDAVAPAVATDVASDAGGASANGAKRVAENPYAKRQDVAYEDRDTNVKDKKTVAERRDSYVKLVGGLIAVAFITPMVQFFFYVRDDPRRLFEAGEHYRGDAQPRSPLEEEEENF